MMLRRAVAATVAGVVLIGGGFWFGGAFAATAEPGSTADPLVTKSYVDEVVASLVSKEYVDQAVARAVALLNPGTGTGGVDKAYVDQAVAKLVEKAYVDQLAAGLADKAYLESRLAQMKTLFEVVRVPKDSIILGESGTEIVLRGGKATAIVSAKGGVLDATDGVDLAQGEPVKPNHLLVIPVSDGRGLTAQADLILIVKGPYTVKAPGQ
ncbi:MAG TPA: hypothetical protein VNT75_04255 [Symbiobacteriaceae bacterium]|nr:hypothetical protein [Symbiobacteriaceae bacterium]